jgi:putative ABC transport system permease protein
VFFKKRVVVAASVALLAAAVPAWIASRQDVVAVLAGRRGDRKPGRRSPVVGVVLLAIGIGLAVLGSRQSAGDLLIAVAAVVSVFGMIFLVPVVVVGVARLGRRMPLPLRYAVRDAARHRTRTVPAVAAVAATVAGVVTLSIANSSDQAQAKADYDPLLPQGLSSVVVNRPHPDWAAVTAAVTRTAGGARVETVHGVATRQMFDLRPPGHQALRAGSSSPYPTPVLVSDGSDEATQTLVSPSLSAEQEGQVQTALASGRAVVFTQDPVAGDHVRLRLGHERLELPTVFVPVGTRMMATAAVLPPSLLQRIDVAENESGLLLAGAPLTASQEDDLRQVLGGLDSASDLYVEHGYQTANAEKIVLWILFGLGAILMLGGTLTATFLALSDARPDLATLSAVGASPRTRRGVAAAYALAVGFVGAVLGAAVGFIPGVAVTYPLTRGFDPGDPSHYLDIPWTLIGGLVIALPLFTALVVGLLARSRLPVVARLD